MARSSLALARCILSRAPSPLSNWSGNYDAVVVLNLSRHLSEPSHALHRKYESLHLSRVATTVDEFLQRQVQISRTYVENEQISKINYVEDQRMQTDDYLSPQTPQKTHHISQMPHGYLTPPITPDTEMAGTMNYMKGSSGLQQRYYPPTPNSGAHAPANHFDYSRNMQQEGCVH